MKKKLASLIILAAAILATGCSSQKSSVNQAADSGIASRQIHFEEAQQAVDYYMDCIAKQEYTKALNVCAIVDPAKGQDFSMIVDNAQIYTVNMPFPEYPQYMDINISSNYSLHLSNLRLFLLTMCLYPENPVEPRSVKGEESGALLYQEFNPEKLKDFQVLRCEKLDFGQDDFKKQAYQRWSEVAESQYGQTDSADFLMLYQANGTTFVGGINCVKYEDGWVIKNLYSTMTGTSVSGAEAGTEEDFEGIFAELAP